VRAVAGELNRVVVAGVADRWRIADRPEGGVG
jgi:hypothetical protein